MRMMELFTARHSLLWWLDALALLANMCILLLAHTFNLSVASFHGFCEPILLLSVMW
jgi:hypothetical protein